MTTTKEAIEATAAQLGITMTAKFVPWSISRTAGEEQPSLNWRVALHRNGRMFLETDYMAGCGHCPGYKQGDRSVKGRDTVHYECEHGRAAIVLPGGGVTNKNAKPLLPALADVLHSITCDAEAIDYATFEAWAESYGYEADSRAVEVAYRDCLQHGLALRSALGEDGLKQLREAVQDY